MPLDFPSNPAVGTYYNGYIWDGTVWDSALQPSVPALLTTAPVYANESARTTAVPSPAEGQLSYLNDINQFQGYSGTSWKGFGGLSVVTPTSVTVGSGSSSTDANGLTTFTSVGTYLMLNGVFTSAFRNYRIHLSTSSSATASIDFRYSASGTSSSTGYLQGNMRAAGNVFDNYSMGTAGPRHYLGIQGSSQANSFAASLDIFTPNLATYTGHVFTGTGYDGTWPLTLSGGGTHQVATSYDGIYFMPASGTITGTVKVYGYN